MEAMLITMSVPFVTWCVIVFAVIAIVVGRAIRHANERRKDSTQRTPLFSLGTEREEFFIPGDKPVYSKDDYDDPYDD